MISFTKLVMPPDLNPANRLFGGKLLAWVDEASALFVMSKLRTKNIVTVTFDEVVFKVPVFSGDILSFDCEIHEIGNTSISVYVSVLNDRGITVFDSYVKFVTIDPATGKSTPHGYVEE
jgi:acyl-CoA hydrolase